MHTLVVIVNYRTGDLTVDCLKSLAPEVARVAGEFGPVRVVVTDNASGDGSAEQIESAITENGWEGWCELRRLPRNGGFAYGNNEGIRPALESSDRPRYVWLLNPDTVVLPGALATLIAFLDAHPKAGIAGSRLEDPDATPQRSAFRFHSVASEVDSAMRLGVVTRLLARRKVAPPVPETSTRTEWIAGASMLIRREVFDRIGLMDEAYFMYFEEVDFCRRAAEAGFECWYVPESRVVHLVGQASGVTDARRSTKRRPDYWFESRRRYFLRHVGRFGTLAADTLFMAGFSVWRLRRLIQRKPDTDPAHFLGDFFRHSTWRRGFGS